MATWRDEHEARAAGGGGAGEGGGGGAGSRPEHGTRSPFELGRARRAAIDTLSAYRAARDPAALAGVFQALADDLPAHWLLAGLLSLSSQLVDYLSVSERLDAEELLRALASLEVEEELDRLADDQPVPPGGGRAGRAAGDPRGDDGREGWARDDALADEQVAGSFPGSDPPSRWAGPPEGPTRRPSG